MDKNLLDTYDAALGKAKEELSKAIYLSESGGNPGLRKMNANKADWLKWVIYLAELGLEYSQFTYEPVESVEESKTDFQKVIALFQSIKSKK
jgi:hypothetical protein